MSEDNGRHGSYDPEATQEHPVAVGSEQPAAYGPDQVLSGFVHSTAIWVLGLIVSSVTTSLLVMFAPPLPAKYYIIFWVLCTTVIMALYIQPMRMKARQNLIKGWQREVTVKHQWVSAKDLTKVLPRLLDGDDTGIRENEIRLVTHKHKFFLWAPISLLATLAFICVGCALTFGSITFTTPSYNGPSSFSQDRPRKHPATIVPESSHTIQLWWVFLILALLCLCAAWIVKIRWHATFILVSNLRCGFLLVWPIWLPLLPGSGDNYQLNTIWKVDAADSLLGNIFGFGNVIADSALDQDPALHTSMKGVPHHDDFAEILWAGVDKASPHRLRG